MWSKTWITKKDKAKNMEFALLLKRLFDLYYNNVLDVVM